MLCQHQNQRQTPSTKYGQQETQHPTVSFTFTVTVFRRQTLINLIYSQTQGSCTVFQACLLSAFSEPFLLYHSVFPKVFIKVSKHSWCSTSSTNITHLHASHHALLIWKHLYISMVNALEKHQHDHRRLRCTMHNAQPKGQGTFCSVLR